MRTEEIKVEINRLEMSEKLLLVEELWDSIAIGNSELTMPEWQSLELDKRYKKYKQGSFELQDWNIVHEELRDKYK